PRLGLWSLIGPGFRGVVYWFARLLRAAGLPRLLAGWGRLGLSMGMLAATKPDGRRRYGTVKDGSRKRRAPTVPYRPLPSSTVLLFRGCVQEGLFSHVHDATVHTLGVNGYHVGDVLGQICCGALHAHAGLLDEARALARTNISAFGAGDEPIVVNSAGCGALMKEYGHLLGDERGARFAARVRDVTELLDPPAPGAPLDLHVAYDPPCHLVHAQRVVAQPLKVFAASHDARRRRPGPAPVARLPRWPASGAPRARRVHEPSSVAAFRRRHLARWLGAFSGRRGSGRVARRPATPW